MKQLSYQFLRIFVLAVLSFTVGCSDDPTETAFDTDHGFAQFRVTKSGVQPMSRADGEDRLDSLSNARKIKVTLSSGDSFIEQTMVLTAACDSLGEYGLRSEKLALLAGDYTLQGYELYDNLDQRLLSAELAEVTVIRIVPGGLTLQDLEVNVIPRGLARFILKSDLSQIETRAAERSYMLGEIVKADVKVRNMNTGEVTTLTKMRTKVQYYYDEEQKGYLTSRSICDTIVPLTAGNYRVMSYMVYDKPGRLLEANTSVAENGFKVENNGITEAVVPITMRESAGHIKDGFALKKIWEALGGSKWSYRGEHYAKGCNWNFNRDVDLWTAQPGVQVLNDGRVASISLGGFGARGAMPEELGELTELRALYLGTHLERTVDSPITSIEDIYRSEGLKGVRNHTLAFIDPDCGLSAFAPDMRSSFSEEQRIRIKAAEEYRGWRSYTPNNDPANYSTAITSLPKTIGRLQKLEMLYIADGVLTTLPDSVALLKHCTEVEIFSCLRMTEFPKAIAQMPAVIMLNMSFNSSLDGESLYQGLKLMARSPIGKNLQGLFLINNNLTKLPDLRGMARLRSLSCPNNKIETIEAPLGKGHPVSKLLLDNNRISSLPVDDEGYFVGFDDNVENISFANNEFTCLPDIFNAKSIYKLKTINFSFNKIATIENADQESYKGVNAEIFNLSYNRLPKFPKCIYNSGSHILYLSLAGNGMSDFETDALKGERIVGTTTMDMSNNRLRELPQEFNNATFPYMLALDMSYNRFDAFPWRAMNLANLNIFILRGQRDADGYRCMKEWPHGIYQHHGLRALLLGSNDIRKVDDSNLSFMIQTLDISDNPNIVINVSGLCPYIKAGLYYLMYDPTQDIRGCDALNLKK